MLKETYTGYGSQAYLEQCRACHDKLDTILEEKIQEMDQILNALGGYSETSLAETQFPPTIKLAQQVYQEAGLSLRDYLLPHPKSSAYFKKRRELLDQI